MNRLTKFVLGSFALIIFFGLTAARLANADTLVCGSNCTQNTASSSYTWTGIVVTGQESGGGYAPTTSTDSITLWYGGSGIEAVAITNCSADCGTVTPGSLNPFGSNAAYAALYGGNFAIDSTLDTTLGPPPNTVSSNPIGCADNGAECNYYDFMTNTTVCWGDLCLGPDNGTIRDITLLTLGSGDFIVEANSVQLSFSLPETNTPPTVPEPSGSLLLASGLLGLAVLSFGFKRLNGFQAS
jgi:hypothetical protein